MITHISKYRFIFLALLLSLSAHLYVLTTIVGPGACRFSLPPNPDEYIVAEFKQLPIVAKTRLPVAGKSTRQSPPEDDSRLYTAEQEKLEPAEPSPLITPEQRPVKLNDPEPSPLATVGAEHPQKQFLPRPKIPAKHLKLLPPIRHIGQFIKTKREKLSYRISLLGIPAGTTELEAHNEHGELRITSRTESTGVLSLIYPVDTMTQTRMFNGRYIMTTMKQRQGDQISDIGFTISLGEKNVFWADRLHKRYTNNQIPNDEVLDIFSALYYLRNQQLTIGKTILLHIFDSSRYVPVPVMIIRREKINLPGLHLAETLLVKPELSTEGFFRRTGEILIWLTDDEYHVPVRMETEIALGRVTAELLNAETDP